MIRPPRPALRRTTTTAIATATLVLAVTAGCGGSGGSGGSAGSGSEPASVTAERAPDGSQTVTVDSRDDPNRFVPRRVEVAAGGDVTLTLTNTGSAPHDLVVDGVEGAKTQVISGGEEETVTFAAPAAGTYDFVCTIHPGMDGELVVS